MKTSLIYSNFVFKLLFKKKSSWVLPLILIIMGLGLTTTFAIVNISEKISYFVMYAIVFVQLLLTIIFAGLKSLNIYKDLEDDGIEILTYAKPLSRKQIFTGKLISFINYGLIWSLIIMLVNLVLAITLKLNSYLIAITLVSFVTFIFAYLIFGSITSLIAYKTNQKIALTLPITVFTPLLIGGVAFASQSTSTVNNMGYYLNLKNKQIPAGNQANLEGFYLNNKEDKLFLIPNGYDAQNLSENQDAYINKAYDISKNSALGWQAYSWLVTPYQMLDIFNFENKNIINAFTKEDESNLNKYIYYNNQDSSLYNYEVVKNKFLKERTIATRNKTVWSARKGYIVPSALKNQSVINFQNQNNTDIIYAREKADNIDIEFPEDKFIFSIEKNLIGRLKWNNIKELLGSKSFNYLASNIFKDLYEQKHQFENLVEMKPKRLKDELLTLIQSQIDDKDSEFNKLIDEQVSVLRSDAFENKIIASEQERQIYLVTALIYYLYFTFNDSKIQDAILIDENSLYEQDNYAPSQFTFRFGEYNYNIGGYASYHVKQQVVDNKVKMRFDLVKSDNYLFSTVDDFAVVSREKRIVNKNYYILIWGLLSVMLLIANNYLYIKKDYK
ncbi:ABC transporter permease [Mycoplasma sp. Pen4]|uniref:ABC transporter permease n=1 Tax=Mycoplasma sp. Pen4 TaxID=640330 RepID=UPI0016542713|nr:ABC transporter permease [Mycoplasma sp. Pen4]QNM93829.1 ABC transporter permease [Mycoplasma sp. Pen4]